MHPQFNPQSLFSQSEPDVLSVEAAYFRDRLAVRQLADEGQPIPIYEMGFKAGRAAGARDNRLDIPMGGCWCDPPGSGEEFCVGACELRYELRRLLASLRVLDDGSELIGYVVQCWLSDEDTIEGQSTEQTQELLDALRSATRYANAEPRS